VHLLRVRGYNAAERLIARHAELLRTAEQASEQTNELSEREAADGGEAKAD
jgi:hypothetical protein